MVAVVSLVDTGQASERADRTDSGPIYFPAGDVDAVESGPHGGGSWQLRYDRGRGVQRGCRANLRAPGEYLWHGFLGHPSGIEEPRGGPARVGARSATRQILGNRRMDS